LAAPNIQVVVWLECVQVILRIERASKSLSYKVTTGTDSPAPIHLSYKVTTGTDSPPAPIHRFILYRCPFSCYLKFAAGD